MIEVVRFDFLHAAADPLADPVIVVHSEEVTIALEQLFGQPAHPLRPEARVNAQILERAIKPVDVLLHLE